MIGRKIEWVVGGSKCTGIVRQAEYVPRHDEESDIDRGHWVLLVEQKGGLLCNVPLRGSGAVRLEVAKVDDDFYGVG